MYFLILRPQQKRVKQHAGDGEERAQGDTVVTSGGLVGRVTKVVDDDQIEVEIADGVRVRQMRQMVTDVRAKGEPVKDDGRRADRGRQQRRQAMLYFSRWKALATLLTALIVCLFAVPNFFSDATLKRWPAWAQRHVVLGLDLQGGSHILLEVDANYVRKEKASSCADDVRRVLREARDRLHRRRSCAGLTVEVRIREEATSIRPYQAARAVAAARRTSQRHRARSLDVVDAGNGLIRLTVTAAGHHRAHPPVVEQSIQIVERRVNELGPVEPLIQRQGIDRILVQVPGLGIRSA